MMAGCPAVQALGRRTQRATCSGFTLLEALIASVLVVIGLAGVMTAVATGVRAQSVAHFYQIAGSLAEQKMADLESDPELEAGENEGDFGDNYPGYRWTSEVVTIEDTDEGPKGLYEVTVTVEEEGAGRSARSTTLVTYLFRQGKS